MKFISLYVKLSQKDGFKNLFVQRNFDEKEGGKGNTCFLETAVIVLFFVFCVFFCGFAGTIFHLLPIFVDI